MPERKGDYFANKAEAIAYYKEHQENFKDKPDWLIECIIDFAIQYPNYKEYCEVEAKVKAGQELTAKQKKKYGNLKWEKEMTEYEEGQVLKDHVTIQEPGTFPDIVNDKEEFEKINKYGLTFNEEAKKVGDPNAPVEIEFKDADGKPIRAVSTADGLMVKDSEKPMLEMAKEIVAEEHKRMTGEEYVFDEKIEENKSQE